MRLKLLCIAMLITACSGQSDAPALAAVASGGRASITAAQLAAVPAISATQDMRIDGSAETLVYVEWIGVAGDGTIAVLQPEAATIRFFGPDGAARGSFGRKGQGPGEFERPVRAGWMADTLWAEDPRLQRIALISPGRELAGSLRRPRAIARIGAAPADSSPYYLFYPRAVLHRDTLLVNAFRLDQPDQLILITADGTFAQHIIEMPPTRESAVIVKVPNGTLNLRIPFLPRDLSSVAPHGRFAAFVATDSEQSTFTLTAVRSNGDTMFVREVSFEGDPIPSDTMDARVEEQLNRAPTPVQRMSAKQEMDALLPKVYPPVTGLVIDDDGRSWVGLHTRDGVRRWVMFDDDGRATGYVGLPAASRLMTATADALYVVEADEYDVESIVRYALSALPRE